jgi:hypothetical protein
LGGGSFGGDGVDAAITGDRMGLFLDFSLRRKFVATVFQGGNGCSPVFDVILTSVQKSFGTFD